MHYVQTWRKIIMFRAERVDEGKGRQDTRDASVCNHWPFHPGNIVEIWHSTVSKLARGKWFTSRNTWEAIENIQSNPSKHNTTGEIPHLHRNFKFLSYSIMCRHLCLLLWEQSTQIYFQHLEGKLTTPCDSLQPPEPLCSMELGSCHFMSL